MVEIPGPPVVKEFILLERTPFVYVKCCNQRLCNDELPDIDETSFREYPGRAGERPRGHAVLSFLSTLALASDIFSWL